MQNLINFSQKLKAKLLIWHPGIPLWIGEYSKNFLRDSPAVRLIYFMPGM